MNETALRIEPFCSQKELIKGHIMNRVEQAVERFGRAWRARRLVEGIVIVEQIEAVSPLVRVVP